MWQKSNNLIIHDMNAPHNSVDPQLWHEQEYAIPPMGQLLERWQEELAQLQASQVKAVSDSVLAGKGLADLQQRMHIPNFLL
jgi:hypothetical protein